jgi:hypothetical protein
MTPEQIKQVAMRYSDEFCGHDRESKRFTLEGQLPNHEQARAHIWWMCYEIVRFVDEGQIEKANRWLGFVQGVLWFMGDKTIREMRDDNR